MQHRPVIGIPTQNLQSFGNISADLPPSWIMSHRYILTLTAVGGVPWMIPLVVDDLETLRAIYEGLDGVFLPGGADVDPASYNADRHPLCDKSDPPRDQLELLFTKWAAEEGKPVLGVCRGLQIMNLAFGGTLVQDLADQMPGSIKHDYFPFGGKYSRDYLSHAVNVREGTKLGEIVGSGEVMVNSMHHQGIARVGDGLVASAIAPDGLVEGIEGSGSNFLVGVQWHPEVLTENDERMKRLFAEFIEAATDFRESRILTSA
jgi:putative glutamine amidotransferase